MGTQGSEQWHFNQIHELVIAANDKYLISYPWMEIAPQIICHTENPDDVGKTFKYEIKANITDCDEKEKSGDVISRDLIICGYTH